ncbi:MAG: CHAT domain-containing protein [Gemmatimonadetes bacterium]|nr:CHAT domain-containing protein [Gemmatimonadota bacterium]
MGDLPVVLLAFANAEEPHLSLLKAESAELWRTLGPLQEAGQLLVHREESAAMDEVREALIAHGDRLVLFHYGGHANGSALALEGGAAHAEGLARLLGQQEGLKLVFLNGCATQGQVRALLDAGVPAVIATAVPIGDAKAQRFSGAFYAALAAGRSVADAFDTARGALEAQFGAGAGGGITFTRSFGDATEAAPVASELAWALFTRPEARDDLAAWRLPDARAAWRVPLTDQRGPLRDVDGAPIVLERRAPVRTVEALRCATCGSCASVPTGATAPACAVCGAGTVTRASARTTLAEATVPFAVAESAVRAALASTTSTGATITLRRLLVPYWVLDVDTRTTVDGERGLNRDLTRVVPLLDWEPVHEVIDVALARHLVAAGRIPASKGPKGERWFWELDAAQPAQPQASSDAAAPNPTRGGDDSATPSHSEGAVAIAERDLQAAFDDASARITDQLDGEIDLRMEGLAQRNVVRDTRYRRVAARTVLLPHWAATVEQGGIVRHYLVNGQTGGVRVLGVGDASPAALEAAAAALATTPVHTDDQGGSTAMGERTYEPGDAVAAPGVAISVFSGVGIGLMVGALLGLSISPVVGIFIGALGTALAALLGLNDPHFSTAKGLRIGSFGFATLVGAALGIVVRTHDLFAPSLEARRDTYMKAGFTQAQALALVARQLEGTVTTTDSAGRAVTRTAALESAHSNLFASEVEVGQCSLLRSRYDDDNGATIIADNFRTQGKGWGAVADLVMRDVPAPDQKATLFLARDLACDPGGKPFVPPTPERCDAVRAALAANGATVASVSAAFDAAPPLGASARRATRQLGAASQLPALRALALTACGTSR